LIAPDLRWRDQDEPDRFIMADYYLPISRAVSALDRNNAENRRVLYERARLALVARLRGIVPILGESDVTRERLTLEEAIRRVELESARNLVVRPASASRWQLSRDSWPLRGRARFTANLNRVRLALRHAVYPTVLASWLFTICLLLIGGRFSAEAALTLVLIFVAVRVADRLHTRLSSSWVGRRSRQPLCRIQADPGQPGDERARVALANRRATALLLENLSDQQRRQYSKYRHFDVIGGESGKRYRIWHRPSMNIQELDAFGQPRWIWCFLPVGLVIGDVLLAQKMALELFETDAIRIANRFSTQPLGVR
jgi:hypothetical protein